MAVPDFQTLMLPVLLAISEGETRIGGVIDRRAEQLMLTPEDEDDVGPGGRNDEPAAPQKIKLADNKERTVQHMMATTLWSVDGRPMSAARFIAQLNVLGDDG